MADLPQDVDLAASGRRLLQPEQVDGDVVARGRRRAPVGQEVDTRRVAGPLERPLEGTREVVVAPVLGDVADSGPRRAGRSASPPPSRRSRHGRLGRSGRLDRGRDLRAPVPDQRDGLPFDGEDDVVVVEPGPLDPGLGLVVDPGERDEAAGSCQMSTAASTTMIASTDGVERQRAIGVGHGPADPPAERSEGAAESASRPRQAGRVGDPDDGDVEWGAREPVAAIEGVEQRVAEDARAPVVEVRLAVPGHPGPSHRRIGCSRRRFVMPQRRAAVIDETTAGGPKLEAQVDVLEAVVVCGREPADLLERALGHQQAGGGQRRPLLDGDGGGGKGVLAGSHDPRQWEPPRSGRKPRPDAGASGRRSVPRPAVPPRCDG